MALKVHENLMCKLLALLSTKKAYTTAILQKTGAAFPFLATTLQKTVNYLKSKSRGQVILVAGNVLMMMLINGQAIFAIKYSIQQHPPRLRIF